MGLVDRGFAAEGRNVEGWWGVSNLTFALTNKEHESFRIGRQKRPPAADWVFFVPRRCMRLTDRWHEKTKTCMSDCWQHYCTCNTEVRNEVLCGLFFIEKTAKFDRSMHVFKLMAHVDAKLWWMSKAFFLYVCLGVFNFSHVKCELPKTPTNTQHPNVTCKNIKGVITEPVKTQNMLLTPMGDTATFTVVLKYNLHTHTLGI